MSNRQPTCSAIELWFQSPGADMETVSPPLPPALMQRLVMAVMVHGIPDSQLGTAFEVLVHALRHPLAYVRELAVVALAELPYAASKRVAALMKALQDDSARVRRRAARALGEFGPLAWPALSVLIAALRDVDGSVRRDAAGALQHFGPLAAPAAASLVALIADPDMRTRAVAAATLRQIGPAAVTALHQARLHAHPELRERIDAWLTRYAPEPLAAADTHPLTLCSTDLSHPLAVSLSIGETAPCPPTVPSPATHTGP